MILQHLETSNFRNLEQQRVEAHSRFNVLAGDNAQGKTNFLEAIYLVATLRSFRGCRSLDMVHFGETTASVKALIERGAIHQELKVHLGEREKKAFFDGKLVRSAASYLGAFSAVLFSPDDLQLPRGSPNERRKLLDGAILTIWPAYLTLARDYQKTLRSRNRILRLRPAKMKEMLEVYDQQLAELGAKIVASRVRYLRVFGEVFTKIFEQISQSGVKGTLRYITTPSLHEAKDSVQELTVAIGKELDQARARGIDFSLYERSIGPHTDDLDFLLDGRSAQRCGSQGQVRSLILAFRLAQILDTFNKIGVHPVLLLDDVSSELDSLRNTYLFNFISQVPCQTFLTTTRLELIPLTQEHYSFKVVRGKLTALGARSDFVK